MKTIRQFEGKHKADIDERFHQLNLANIGNVLYWKIFFDMARTVPGDIVECGIGRSRSLVIVSALNFLLDAQEGGQRRLFGYDSFAGFPEPTPEDPSPRNPRKGEWSQSPSGKYQYTEEFSRLVLKEAGVPVEEIPLTLTKGYFSDSLKSHPDRPIAILHIDGDLYQSYMDTLNHLYGRVSKGGVIIFDDFISDPKKNAIFPGAGRAVQEFLGDKFGKIKESIVGNYYYVKE